MLEAAQESIIIDQPPGLGRSQQAELPQRLQCRHRTARAQPVIAPATHDAESLRQELDFAYAAAAKLHVKHRSARPMNRRRDSARIRCCSSRIAPMAPKSKYLR